MYRQKPNDKTFFPSLGNGKAIARVNMMVEDKLNKVEAERAETNLSCCLNTP